MTRIIALCEPYNETVVGLLDIDDSINIEETFQTFHDKFAASLPPKPIYDGTITLDKYEANATAWLATMSQMELELLEKYDCFPAEFYSHHNFHRAFIGFLVEECGAKLLQPSEGTLPFVTYRNN